MKKKRNLLTVLLALAMMMGLTLTVHAAALSKTKLTMTKGTSKTIVLNDAKGTVKWSSSNKAVATVNASGKITAKKAGKAVITAKNGSKKYKCTVTVKAKVSLATLKKGDFSAFAGTYVATKESNNGYGGGKALLKLVLKKNGSISGGGAYYYKNPYPSSKPTSVKKNTDGAYVCKLSKNCTLMIYPKGAIENRDYVLKNQSYLKNTVYVRVILEDGGVMDATYYKK